MKPRREGLPLTRDEWNIMLEALDRCAGITGPVAARDEAVPEMKRIAKLVRGMSVMRRG